MIQPVVNTAGTANTQKMSAKVYGCQVYRYGSQKIMDLTPAFDNKISMRP